MSLRKVSTLLLSLVILLLAGCHSSLTPPSAPVVSESVSLPSSAQQGQLTLWMLDVGQGDCLLLKSPAGKFMLIDGGPGTSGDKTTQKLRSLGVKELAVLVVSHPHEDHIGGLDTILAAIPAQKAYLPAMTTTTRTYQGLWQRLKLQEAQIVYPQAGDKIGLDSAIDIKVLGPVKSGYEELNDGSLVLQVNYGGTSLLLTGDITVQAEDDLLNSRLIQPITVLKVAHHGSNGSTSWQLLNRIKPAIALISVGEDNDYGHPGSETISRLQAAGANIYRTDQQGTIRITSNGQQVLVYNEKKVTPADTPNANWVGNRKSRLLHQSDCDHLPAVVNRVIFASQDDAQKAGYRPCVRCFPDVVKAGNQ